MSELFGTKLTMNLGEHSYDIILKNGALENLYQFARLDRRVAVVTDTGVPAAYAQRVADQCKDAKIITVPQGEASKSFKILETVLRQMLEFNMGRGDLVIAVGGGVVGDLAGFAASIYMRGIDFINCPTTTLSMIDSSIGGKTAVDLGDTKNIVGAFWQPKLVIVDPETLSTLPRRHYINGLAEAVKASLLADPELFAIFEKGEVDARIGEIIYRSLRFKKNIVEPDEQEHGMRKALRLAHQCFCLSGQCGGVIQRERRIGDARAPGNMGGNVNARPAQGVQHDGTARHQRGSDAAGEVSAAPGILKAVVFGVGRIIGVAGAEQVGGLGVIAAAGVLVLDHQGNGRAGSVAVDHARKKLDLIGLHPGGGKTVAPGPALIHAGGQQRLVHRDAGGHAVQHRADGFAVALAEDGQRQCAAKGVFHLSPPCPARCAGPPRGWSRPASSQGPAL